MRRSGKSCFYRSYSHPQSAMGPRHSQEPSWVSGVNKISEEGSLRMRVRTKRKHRNTRGGHGVQSARAPTLPPPLSQQAIITTPSFLLWPFVSAEWRTGRHRLTAAAPQLSSEAFLSVCVRGGKKGELCVSPAVAAAHSQTSGPHRSPPQHSWWSYTNDHLLIWTLKSPLDVSEEIKKYI